MSVNWVMLAPTVTPPYTPLPSEKTLFSPPPRIGFSITTAAHFPGKQQQPFSLSSSSGKLYLTNRRIIYLPDKPTDQLKSFATPLLNLHDSHVTAPFFGPNVWMALLQPVPGGGIPVPAAGVVEIKFTFKEGGAFDFHTQYERVRERLYQAMEVARMDGGEARNGIAAGANGLDVGNVDLEELPAYQEESEGPLLSPVLAAQAVESAGGLRRRRQVGAEIGGDDRPITPAQPPPDEPPPGYEEAQAQGVQVEVERRSSDAR